LPVRLLLHHKNNSWRKTTTMRSLELFSGCGGLALGLSRAGFHHELMVEWNRDAVATVDHNKRRGIKFVKDWPLHGTDVRSVDWRNFLGRIDLLAGGPPCQPFSIGGKHRAQDDDRDMWPEAIRAVRETRPRAFLFENVRGIARPTFASYLGWITAHLRRPFLQRRSGETHEQHTYRLNNSTSPAWYEPVVLRLNAADFGAPQKRHRVIIAGLSCDGGAQLPKLRATHSRERLLWDQWITGEYWEKHALKKPVAQLMPTADMAVVKRLRTASVPPPGLPWVTVRDALAGLGEPTGEANHVYQAGARVYAGHTGSALDQPAKALKAGDHGVPGGENMMVLDDGSVRYFTVRESARLQGLPDTFRFACSWSESMRQLGNAVPCQLSEVLGRWIVEALEQAGVYRKEAA
jgi:DNA (cytosine-5)-methyltransferase 1